MEDSILKSVKEVCSYPPEDTSSDGEFLSYINAAFANLQQIGGSPGVIQIEDDAVTWSDMGLTDEFSGMVRSYINLFVKMMYDPPTLGFLIDLKQKQLAEHATRINIYAEVGLNG